METDLKKVNLSFNIHGNKTYEFTTSAAISENSKPPVKHTSLRKVSIERIESDEHSILFRIKCINKKIKLGGYLKKAQEIVFVTSGIYDNLLVEANSKGELIALHNISDIREEFETKREELSANYSGIEFEDYMDGLEKKLNNPKEALEELKQHNFFGLFFNGVYRHYFEYQTIIKNSLYSGFNERIAIDESYTLKADEANPKQVHLSFFGQNNNPTNKYEANSEGVYLIDEVTNWVIEANLQVDEKADNITRNTSFQLKEIQ